MTEKTTTTTVTTIGGGEKSLLVAYLLWFFLGGLGAHRFYTGRTGSAVAMAGLLVGSWILYATLIGAVLAFPMTIALGIWWLVDAFRMPSWGLARGTMVVQTTEHVTRVDE